MRKLFAMLLCLAVMLSLVACGQKEETPATTGQVETTQTTTTAATTEATVTEATEPMDTAATETKPEETKPEETKPTETKPEETKPAETKPEETKPEETKPAETKPEETKPEETEPEETKPKIPLIQTMSQKEQLEAFAGVVGMHYFDATEKLGWKESQLLQVETSCYRVPLQVYLDGTEFQVFFGINEDTHKISEVFYKVEVPTNGLEVAQLALNTVSLLDSWLGKENQLAADGSFALRDATQLDISAGIALDEWAYSMLSWDYSRHATAEQKKFVKECGNNTGFGVFFEVSRACLTEGDKVTSDTCTISFSVGVIPV